MDPTDLQPEMKRRRQSKLERLESIRAGRGPQYSKQKGGGSTNAVCEVIVGLILVMKLCWNLSQEKARKKNYKMVQHSFAVQSKLRRSLQTQQVYICACEIRVHVSYGRILAESCPKAIEGNEEKCEENEAWKALIQLHSV